METFILKALLVILGVVGILILILMAYHPQILPLLFNSKGKVKKERFLVKLKKSISKIFHHRMKIIRGKILNLVVQKTILDGKIFNLDFHIIVEDNNGKIRSIGIPKIVFAQLNQQRKFFIKKNISLYFRDYFFNDYFDHYEIA